MCDNMGIDLRKSKNYAGDDHFDGILSGHGRKIRELIVRGKAIRRRVPPGSA